LKSESRNAKHELWKSKTIEEVGGVEAASDRLGSWQILLHRHGADRDPRTVSKWSFHPRAAASGRTICRAVRWGAKGGLAARWAVRRVGARRSAQASACCRDAAGATGRTLWFRLFSGAERALRRRSRTRAISPQKPLQVPFAERRPLEGNKACVVALR